MEFAVAVSQKLKREMEKRGITKACLAEKSNLSVGTITKLLDAETAYFRINTLAQIIKALNMSYAEFFDDELFAPDHLDDHRKREE